MLVYFLVEKMKDVNKFIARKMFRLIIIFAAATERQLFELKWIVSWSKYIYNERYPTFTLPSIYKCSVIALICFKQHEKTSEVALFDRVIIGKPFSRLKVQHYFVPELDQNLHGREKTYQAH